MIITVAGLAAPLYAFPGLVQLMNFQVPSAKFSMHQRHMTYSLNPLNGGYIGDYIGDYYRGY